MNKKIAICMYILMSLCVVFPAHILAEDETTAVPLGAKTVVDITFSRMTEDGNAKVLPIARWNWSDVSDINYSWTTDVWDGGTIGDRYLQGEERPWDVATWHTNRPIWNWSSDVRRFRAEFTIPQGYSVFDDVMLASVGDYRELGLDNIVPINDNIYVFIYPKDTDINDDNFLDYLAFWTGSALQPAVEQINGDQPLTFHDIAGIQAFDLKKNTEGSIPKEHPLSHTDGWYSESSQDNVGHIMRNSPDSREFVVDLIIEDFAEDGGMDRLNLTFTKTQEAGRYGYAVEYYSGSVSEKNKIGVTSGTALYDEGHQLAVDDISSDLGVGWQNTKRPSGHNNGAVQGEFPVISDILKNNVVRVLYTPAGGRNETSQHTVTVKYLDINGVEIDAPIIETLSRGSSYNVTAHDIEDFRFAEMTVNGTTSAERAFSGSIDGDLEIIFVYAFDRPSLEVAAHNWYIRGYPDNTIAPNGNVTRAEMAMVFFRLTANVGEITVRQVFVDAEPTAWYGKAITYLRDHGIISGYKDGLFRPNDPITRAEMAKMASMFDNLSYHEDDMFADVPPDHWAHAYIGSSVAKGWLHGYEDGSFRPNNYASRAEMATLVNGVLNRRISGENIPEEIHKWDDLQENHWAYTNIIEAAHSHRYERNYEDDYEIWFEIVGTGIDEAWNE